MKKERTTPKLSNVRQISQMLESEYQRAVELERSDDLDSCKRAAAIYASITEWKDSALRYEKLTEHIQEMESEQQSTKKSSRRKRGKIALIVVGALMLLAAIGYFIVYPAIEMSNGRHYSYVDMYQIEEYKVSRRHKEVDLGGCESLRKLVIQEDVEYLGLWGCTNLEELVVPSLASLETVPSFYLIGCINLRSIRITDQDYVPAGAFKNFSGIEKIVFDQPVRYIDDEAFSGCRNLSVLELGNKFVSIGDEAFLDCVNLKDFSLSENLVSIGENAFKGSGISSVYIPASVEYICSGAFVNTPLEYAKFVSASGWQLSDYYKTNLPYSEYKDPAVAAQLLKHKYSYYNWSKD